MKKYILYIAITISSFSVVSCDYILKPKPSDSLVDSEEKNIILGTDSDSQGCVTSAGYKWSKLNNECIRVFEKGMRLVPVDANDLDDDEVDLAMLNAYLLFNDDKTKAEVFLYSEKESLEMDQVESDVYEYKNWKLFTLGKYKLEENNILKYISPTATEKQIEGDLEYEMSDAIISQ
jgi:hypothetical protein